MTPRIVHMMYFPWDRDQRLKDSDEDFDHGPYEAMREYAPDFEVRLWTYSQVRAFCRETYPEVWKTVAQCPRPVMQLDILRWIVVHHFGGIYWQMNTTPLAGMAAFLPAPGKDVRLFTECVLSPEKCRSMAAEPIRNGEPEEPVRVLIGVLAARARTAFVEKTIGLLLERARTLQPKTDYDILYITGNAAASTAYDRFGKGDPAVELVDLEETRQIMKVNYQGSWRVDPAGPAKARLPATGSISRRPRLRILADGYYRTIGRHPHEEMLAAQDAVRVRQSCLPDIEAWIAKRSVGHVFEAPCGTFVSVPDGMAYGGGDPNRTVVARNRQLARGTGARFRHLQMLYSRFPTADLFICPDFLEWLPFAEAFRVLQRIAVSKPRMVAFTGYRLLRQSWDTALGDFRPIHLELPPFSFPPPAETLPLPTKPVGGRPDRSLMLWELAALRPRLS